MRILLMLLALGLCANAQEYTNLNSKLQEVFLSMAPEVQTNTLSVFADYNKAVKRSPEFHGIRTNSVFDETGTNIIGTIVTTNHVKLNFTEYFQMGLAQEKVGRVLDAMNSRLQQEMYRAVGKTTVDGWTP